MLAFRHSPEASDVSVERPVESGSMRRFSAAQRTAMSCSASAATLTRGIELCCAHRQPVSARELSCYGGGRAGM
jgi:hypothetical protein